MDFTDLYYKLEGMFGKESISMPFATDSCLDSVIEGAFLLRLDSKPAQELAKGMVKLYLLDEKAKGKDMMLVVLTADEKTGSYGSPVAVKSKGIFYDEFPENIDMAMVYCMERHVFDAFYGNSLIKPNGLAFA